MKVSMSKDIMLCTSHCDNTGRVGIPETLDLFMDMATEHGEQLGVGMDEMASKNWYWVAVKTKLRFVKRPRLGERVTLNTWISPAEKISSTRNYSMTQGDEVLVVGKTQWATVNTENGTLVPMSQVFKEAVTDTPEMALPEKFARIKEGLPDELIGTHKITSRDIDVGQHMNNVEYLHAFHNLYTTKEWEEVDVHEVELQYKLSCFEGEVLEFYGKREGENLYVKGAVDGKTRILMVVK